MAEIWRNRQVVAWTDHDGPGRPPRGPSQIGSVAVACTLGAVFVGVMFTDTLCPEHRTWVHWLSATAFGTAVVAIVGVLRGWAAAPFITLVAAACGVAIGILDAVHAPARGWLLAAGFGASGLLAVALGVQAMRLAWWERRALRSVSDEPMRPVEATAASGVNSAERTSATR